ncbi:MAG: sugar transferase [Chloroflexota bacterium]
MTTLVLKRQTQLGQSRFQFSLYNSIYRLIEVILCSLGCVLLVLLIPCIWLLNRFFAPGPLFYQQQRVGQHGKPFTIFKFRSMVVDAESNGPVWAKNKDARVTPIGHFLRRAHIDELPQLWNILCGEMSLIGPRPERPEFVCQLVKEVPDYDLRHMVRPGLTGWAQVNYGYGSSVDDATIKLDYDLQYVQNRSWRMDMAILCRTVWVVFCHTVRG